MGDEAEVVQCPFKIAILKKKKFLLVWSWNLMFFFFFSEM